MSVSTSCCPQHGTYVTEDDAERVCPSCGLGWVERPAVHAWDQPNALAFRSTGRLPQVQEAVELLVGLRAS